MSAIQEAKQRILLPEVARTVGIPAEHIPSRDGETVRCPFHLRHAHGDRNPSFNYHGGLQKFKCFACGTSGDAVDLIAEYLDVPQAEAIHTFLEMAGGGRIAAAPVARPVGPALDAWGDTYEKRERRKGWPDLAVGSPDQLATLADLRDLSVDTMKFASARGWLRFTTLRNHAAWVLVSHCRRIAQARRCDGGPWTRDGSDFKSWTLGGSIGCVPLGLETLCNDRRPAVMAEGGPDFLSLVQLLIEEGRFDLGILGMLGASMSLAQPVLDNLVGRSIRILAHADSAGREAAARWAADLSTVGCTVDAFDFSAFALKDCNDFIRLPRGQREVNVLP